MEARVKATCFFTCTKKFGGSR